MQPFSSTDLSLSILATVESFVADNYVFKVGRHDMTASADEELALWPQYAKLGLLAIDLPEEVGGMDLQLDEIAAVSAAIGLGLGCEPFIETALMVAPLIEKTAPQACQKAALDSLLNGESLFLLVDGSSRSSHCINATGTPTGEVSLHGKVAAISFTSQAQQLMVLARNTETGADSLFVIPRNYSGVTENSYRLLDGRIAVDIEFQNCVITDNNVVWQCHELGVALHQIAQTCLVARMAQAVAIMDAALKTTQDYLCTRIQFGVLLASFQALQHRIADMYVALEQAFSMVSECINLGRAGDTAIFDQSLLSARILVAEAAQLIGHEAVQMHGGIGVTDECIISHYNNRLQVLNRLYFCPALALTQLSLGPDDQHLSLDMETNESKKFRDQVQQFIGSALPDSIRQKVKHGHYLDKSDYVEWQQILFRQGWFPPSWSKTQGGPGWSIEQQQIFSQEAALNNAPEICPYGVNMIGPVLHEYGSDKQKSLYLEDIRSSDVWWCQGYSEPNAGSDLASLGMSAVREGDYYILNGSKIWTTEAQWADKMHCLVRTKKTTKKQHGITFLVLDMSTPGLTVRPIITLDQLHHTNQVFFDNVKVPVENRIGNEGEGWRIAKYLLSHERAAVAQLGVKLRLHSKMRALCQQQKKEGKLAPDVKLKLTRQQVRLAGLAALERHYLSLWMKDEGGAAGASVLKLLASELYQSMTELWVDMLGVYGAAYDVSDIQSTLNENNLASCWQQAAPANYAYLYSRIHTIAGGSSEVQRNIIAKLLLTE